MKKVDFLHPSRRRILRFLIMDDFSAVELTDKLDIQLSTVRDHLGKLEKKGYIENYFEKAKRGRPKKKYTLTFKGRKVFPRKYRFVLAHVLRAIEDLEGVEALRNVLEEASKNIHPVKGELSEETLEDRLEKMVEFRKNLDLSPQLSRENGSYLLKHGNCGCLELDKDIHEHICYLCRQVISNFLPECGIEQVKSFGEGDDACVHRITPRR